MNLLQRYKAWRKRRYWARLQLEHLRNLISSDWRWLAHDPVARELTDRYMRALRDDWYTLSHEGPDTFRRRIGLEPGKGLSDAQRYRKLQRQMSSNVPEGWREVENMGSLCAWESWEAMDGYLDSLPECKVGLMSPPVVDTNVN